MKNIIDINGLPGIGTNGQRGKKGEKGIDTILFNEKYKSYPYLYIDKNFNMNYIDNSINKTIYNSDFYNVDNFELSNNNIYTNYNLLYQKNIYSHKHRKIVAPDIDYKLNILDGEITEESARLLSIRKNANDSSITVSYNMDKGFCFSGNKILLNSKRNSYFYSKEQSVLKYIYNNVINLITFIPTFIYEDDKKYNIISLSLKQLKEYLLEEYTLDYIKEKIKIELYRNDNISCEGKDVLLKNFNEDFGDMYNYSFFDDFEEYNFTYFLKIYLIAPNDNIFLMYIYTYEDIKKKKVKEDIIDDNSVIIELPFEDVLHFVPQRDDFVSVDVVKPVIIDSSSTYDDTDYTSNSSNNLNHGSGVGGYVDYNVSTPTGQLNNGYNNSYNDGYNSGNTGMGGYKPGWNRLPQTLIQNTNQNKVEIITNKKMF